MRLRLENMNTETKRQRFYPIVIAPAIVIPIVLGVQQWQEDPAHGAAFLWARFLIVGVLAATAGGAAGFFALRFVDKK